MRRSDRGSPSPLSSSALTSPSWLGFARRARVAAGALVIGMVASAGCGGPNQANVDLRKKNEALTDQLALAQRQHEADVAALVVARGDGGTVPTLSPERLGKLITAHGIRLNKLTAAADLDPNRAGDDGINVSVSPTDIDEDPIKAAGTFVVEAFDLAAPDSPLVGRWTFDEAAALKGWYSHLTLYEYILPCPWKQPPAHEQVTVKVTFIDSLTQRRFEAQKVVKVKLAPTTQPAASG